VGLSRVRGHAGQRLGWLCALRDCGNVPRRRGPLKDSRAVSGRTDWQQGGAEGGLLAGGEWGLLSGVQHSGGGSWDLSSRLAQRR
jgi:hypothetical protein